MMDGSDAILPARNPKRMFGDLQVFEVLGAGAQDRSCQAAAGGFKSDECTV